MKSSKVQTHGKLHMRGTANGPGGYKVFTRLRW